MKIISEFEDMKISMGFRKSYVPYVKVSYKSIEVMFSIESGEMIDFIGKSIDDFPSEKERLVNAWMIIHKKELLDNWKRLVEDENSNLNYIKPLK